MEYPESRLSQMIQTKASPEERCFHSRFQLHRDICLVANYDQHLQRKKLLATLAAEDPEICAASDASVMQKARS